MSEEFEQRLQLHSVRMDSISESVHEAQKTATETAGTLHDLVVGIENLGESVKQLREEVRGWEEPEAQEEIEKGNQELKDLMEEVSLTIPVASEQSLPMTQPPAVNVPIFIPTGISSSFVFPDTQSNFYSS